MGLDCLSLPEGTDKGGSSEVPSASSLLATLGVVKVFLEKGGGSGALLEENCPSKSNLDLQIVGLVTFRLHLISIGNIAIYCL